MAGGRQTSDRSSMRLPNGRGDRQRNSTRSRPHRGTAAKQVRDADPGTREALHHGNGATVWSRPTRCGSCRCSSRSRPRRWKAIRLALVTFGTANGLAGAQCQQRDNLQLYQRQVDHVPAYFAG
jgi:hypothetical protein